MVTALTPSLRRSRSPILLPIESSYIFDFLLVIYTDILWPTFLPQKVSVYLEPLLRNPPRKLPNSLKWRSR